MASRYDPQQIEPALASSWQESGIYHFHPESDAPIYSIDTPPPSVSGHLHLGNVYSYSHTDFIARFRRMRGENVFYPMGFDDNGLPTERLVERQLGKTAEEMGREAFIQACLTIGREMAGEYRALWERLGLSIDWRWTYSTIDELSRRTAQMSFIDLYRKDLAYRAQAPVIWCPHCRTAIAQAEVDDVEKPAEFVTIPFAREGAGPLQVATTRPELLPACVAVFVHPRDERYQSLIGHTVTVPLTGQTVPVLADEQAQPEKGTGAVMCCTFGDTTDIEWWRTHHLPTRQVLDEAGRLTTGIFAGEPAAEARRHAIEELGRRGEVLESRPVEHSVRAHERCGTPVEYIVTHQWFIRLLDHKEQFLKAGDEIHWFPQSMETRYREWVEGLRWDWLISRQRYYGVPFPVWYCSCGEILLADIEQLPIDPTVNAPPRPCNCGSEHYTPETDVMDTWATSSLSPQIVSRWLVDPALYHRLFPMSLRPQAYEIIRTWAFYTIVQSQYHFGLLPWKDIMISGWGVAPAGAGKISKSKGGGPMAPMQTLRRYSADAVRYWAASTGTGKDAVISEEKMQSGAKLVTKLWNVANLSRRFLEGYRPPAQPPALSPADRWILDALQQLVARATSAFEGYDYSVAKSDTEVFFWRDLADNYLEMAKRRLYDPEAPLRDGALYTLYTVLLTTLKLFAPILPFITDAIYRELFRDTVGAESIHVTAWPHPQTDLIDRAALEVGAALLDIATTVRRYKSDHNLSLGSELPILEIETPNQGMAHALSEARDDIQSVTRARDVAVTERINPALERLAAGDNIVLGIENGVRGQE